ncbi:MAG TPA: hydrogenase expression protein HypE, partial [Blastocatellia bacterium]|nr:hydrogenase expression protein HypE [Blastocatellia bacterium]
FMDEPPGARLSSGLISASYGGVIRALRAVTNSTANKEPKWRHPGTRLTTGYRPRAY